MDNQPPPLPWPPPRDPSRSRNRPCLWSGTLGCVTLLVLLIVLAGIVLLVKFIWGLHIEQWL